MVFMISLKETAEPSHLEVRLNRFSFRVRRQLIVEKSVWVVLVISYECRKASLPSIAGYSAKLSCSFRMTLYTSSLVFQSLYPLKNEKL